MPLAQKMATDLSRDIRKVVQAYRNDIFIDESAFSSLERLDYFVDETHLNLFGSLKFMKILKEKMEPILEETGAHIGPPRELPIACSVSAQR
jgi:hypothetical protein